MPLLPKIGVALAGVVLAGGCAHQSAAPLPTRAEAISWLPEDSASGVPLKRSELEGRVVLVTFIATWCFPCLAELVTLDALARSFAAKGLVNVLVGLDLEGHRVLAPFANAYELRMPLVVSTPALREGATPFGRIREVPTRFLFGRDGRLIDAYWGVVAPASLREVVERAINEPAPATTR